VRMCFSTAAATLAAATVPCAVAISPAMMVRLVMIGLLLNVRSCRPSWYWEMSVAQSPPAAIVSACQAHTPNPHVLSVTIALA
jgi:hypothetical protein